MYLKRAKTSGAVIIVVIAAAITLPLLIGGCGNGNSPEGAVMNYLNSWQRGDWEGFKASIAPENVYFEEGEEELAKQAFSQIQVEFDGLKMTTTYEEGKAEEAEVPPEKQDQGAEPQNGEEQGEEGREQPDKTGEPEEWAKVTIVAGKQTVTSKVLGEETTETKDLGEENIVFDTVKIDGTWYVDVEIPF